MYCWDGVLNDCSSGEVKVISDSIDNARLQLIHEDVLSERDMNKVLTTEPDVIEIKKGLTIYVHGSA